MASTKTRSGGRTTPRKATQGTPTAATSASEWKKSSGAEGALVVVPSGKVVRMRSPGMQAFLAQGTIPNALLPFVQDMMKKGGKVKEEDEDAMVASLLTDNTKLTAILDLADAVVLDCVIEPEIHDVPRDDDGEIIPYAKRDQSLVWIDQDVDFNDKMFIFNVAVGGPASVEKFREGPGASLAGLSAG